MSAFILDTSTPKCDFCSWRFAEGEGRWLYNVRAVAIVEADGVPVAGSDNLWMACDACEEDIRHANRRRLAARGVKTRRLDVSRLMPEDDAIALVTNVHAETFWRPYIEAGSLARPLRRFS